MGKRKRFYFGNARFENRSEICLSRVADDKKMPGVIAVPDILPIGQAIDELLITLQCSLPDELENRVLHLPL